MNSLYTWLNFLHLAGLATFLFSHGVSGAASLLLRAPVSSQTRQLLGLSRKASMVADPALLLVILTGVWMGFSGGWWGHGWIWASIVVLVLVLAAMGFIARPYYLARAAAQQSDEVLAQHLARTMPVPAIWIGGVGLVLLIGLMVFRPF